MQKNLRVTLVDSSGSENIIALAAWQSTFKELNIDVPDNIDDRVDAIFNAVCKTKKKTPLQLLEMLAEHQHHTPFEFCDVVFDIQTDIATHIQILKHRVGVTNSKAHNTESARYKELEDKFYIPSDWLGTDNMVLNKWAVLLDQSTKECHRLYHKALKELTPILGRTRAKESARYFLPYNKVLNQYVKFNMRSLMHFLSLRNSKHAQLEIRTIAQMMLDEVRKTNRFPLTLKAFGHE